MDNAERNQFVDALRKAKDTLAQSLEYVMGTGKYAKYFPICQEAIKNIDECNVGGHENDYERFKRIITECGVVFDEKETPEHPEVLLIIEIEDCQIHFDEIGRFHSSRN